ncbi:MAG TPA: inositol monophosphatase family protein [Thermoleophilaceae bacterium]|nr:inositol monophosphatase family protein [Thermoleophilaceae bacterium]
MGSQNGVEAALSADWLGAARRAARAARETLARYPGATERARETGRGEGGDMTLAIDRAVEDAVLDELAAVGVGVDAVSEERGRVPLSGGGPALAVVDPIDGSLNAKRRLRPYSLSIAVAGGEAMRDVAFGYVADLSSDDEWWAARGRGAHHGDDRLALPPDPELEILGVESARPELVAAAGDALTATGARRLRMIGSIALSLCHVAAGRFDGLVSLRPCRSVDAAAGQLVVREAGGEVVFPDTADGALGASLTLSMRSRVVAAPSASVMEQLGALATPVPG